MGGRDPNDILAHEGEAALRAEFDAKVVDLEAARAAKIVVIVAELDKNPGRDALKNTVKRLGDEFDLSDGEIKQRLEPIVVRHGLYNGMAPVAWSEVLKGTAAEAAGDNANKRKRKRKTNPRTNGGAATVGQRGEDPPPPTSPDAYGAEPPPRWPTSAPVASLRGRAPTPAWRSRCSISNAGTIYFMTSFLSAAM